MKTVDEYLNEHPEDVSTDAKSEAKVARMLNARGKRGSKKITDVMLLPSLPFPKLTETQKAIAALLAHGLEDKEILRAVKISHPTLQKYKRIPAVQAEIEKRRALWIGQVGPQDQSAIFEPLVPLAEAVYKKALEGKNATTVAADVFDRIFGKPVIRKLEKSMRVINITFTEKGDASKFIAEDDED